MLPYAAYLRVYEPLSAFAEEERSYWAAYATREDRPRRANALEAEHLEAVYRIIALPPIAARARPARRRLGNVAGQRCRVQPGRARRGGLRAARGKGGSAARSYS